MNMDTKNKAKILSEGFAKQISGRSLVLALTALFSINSITAKENEERSIQVLAKNCEIAICTGQDESGSFFMVRDSGHKYYHRNQWELYSRTENYFNALKLAQADSGCVKASSEGRSARLEMADYVLNRERRMCKTKI